MNDVASNLKQQRTLRIVLTNQCNGKCFFCHHEGETYDGKNIMPYSMIENHIIPAIRDIGISKVTLTGGEPSTYPHLLQTAKGIREKCGDIDLHLTTNGLNLDRISSILSYLDKITFSVSSLDERVYFNYTCINPYSIIERMKHERVKKKAISIVITKQNERELIRLIDLFTLNGYDIKLQFVIPPIYDENEWKESMLQMLFAKYGIFSINLCTAPPILYKILPSGNEIRIKLASLNQWYANHIYSCLLCKGCQKKLSCVEQACAIRVYPDGSVSPCLDKFIAFSSSNAYQNIIDAYNRLGE